MIALSVNRKKELLLRKAGGYGFSVICGIACSCLLAAAFSGIMYVLGASPQTAGVLSAGAFAAGCFTAGLICGCIKKKGGLRVGAVCAVIMSAVLMIFSALSGNLTGTQALSKLIVSAVSSCAGAVIAVNRR